MYNVNKYKTQFKYLKLNTYLFTFFSFSFFSHRNFVYVAISVGFSVQVTTLQNAEILTTKIEMKRKISKYICLHEI